MFLSVSSYHTSMNCTCYIIIANNNLNRKRGYENNGIDDVDDLNSKKDGGVWYRVIYIFLYIPLIQGLSIQSKVQLKDHLMSRFPLMSLL